MTNHFLTLGRITFNVASMVEWDFEKFKRIYNHHKMDKEQTWKEIQAELIKLGLKKEDKPANASNSRDKKQIKPAESE
jgi:hypothetical protein